MMTLIKAAAPVLLLTLASCASAPSDIAPAMVDTSRYAQMSCEGLLLAAQNEAVNLEQVSKDQRTARNWDIALNLLIIPGAGAVTGDSEREVAAAKNDARSRIRQQSANSQHLARSEASIQAATLLA